MSALVTLLASHFIEGFGYYHIYIAMLALARFDPVTFTRFMYHVNAPFSTDLLQEKRFLPDDKVLWA